MYLAKQLTSKSLPDIGRHFGDRDHTTVMHAVSRVGELMGQDAAFAEDVELLRRMLESWPQQGGGAARNKDRGRGGAGGMAVRRFRLRLRAWRRAELPYRSAPCYPDGHGSVVAT